MKSKLLQTDMNPDFFDDVKRLAKLPEEAFKKLLSAIETYESPSHFPDNEDLMPIAQTTGVTVHDLLRSFAVAFFLHTQEDSNKDPLHDILQDLVFQKRSTTQMPR